MNLFFFSLLQRLSAFLGCWPLPPSSKPATLHLSDPSSIVTTPSGPPLLLLWSLVTLVIKLSSAW